MYVAESKLKMLSPDGRSRMWDADANGYARGEGIAAVVLKTLSQAIADGDHIDCIIRETGFNQDGRTSGITMPSNVAQASLIRDTYIKAGLDPKNPLDRPQFFHAHGTGTPAGDPQEAEAISRSFYNEGEKADDKLFVGSIKTVIGHTEGTAGLASLIGTSLALQNRTIPPNMHLNKLSDKVRPYYDNLEVPVAAKDWPVVPAGQPLRASVNSFGFGGANAHAILESYEPEVHRAAIAAPLFTPLTFSANTEKSLKRMLQASADFLKENDDLSIHDVAYTLQSRRSALPFKAAISGKTVDALISAIEEVTASKDSIGVKSTASKDLSILGVFTGQGAQWPMMGKQLLKSSPYAAKVIADLEKSLQDLPEADRPSWSIRAELEAGKKTSRLSEAALSQPLCTAVQVVLVDLLKAAGISFKAVVGHSSGEIAAAYAAGFISASDAIRIAYYRGVYAQLAGSSSGSKGSMMAVGTSLEDAEEFCALEQFAGRLTVAASNGAASVTLSGDEDAVDEAEEIFKDEGKFARKLRVDTAYHSFHMIPCSRPYLEALERAKVAFGEGSSSTTWFSSVTGNTKMTKETLGGQYWVDNMRNPVLFSQAVASAVQGAGPFDLAIEVGPHPALKGPAQDNIEAASGTPGTPYTGLLSRGADDVNAFSAGLGYIWERFGAGSVNFDGYEKLASGVSEEKTLVHSFPAYTWDHDTSYWTASRVSGSYKSRDEKPHPILGVKVEEGCTGQQVLWRNLLYPREISWMTGHKLQGQIVFPASGYAAMAVEAIMTLAGENSVSLIEIQDFQIARAITFLEESTGIEVAFTMGILSRTDEAVTADFQVSSCPRGERAMVLNASGTVTIELGDASVEALATAPVPKFNMVDVDIDRFYNTLTELGYNYSPPFHALTSISRRTDAAIGVMTDVRGSTWEDNLLIHPGILDTAFQTVFAAFSSPGDERLWGIYVPTGIKRISINPSLAVFPAGKEAQWPWQTSVTSGPEAIPVADIEVFADNGKDVMLEIEGIKLVPLSAASADNDEHLFSSFMYSLAKPDGDIAGPNKPTDFDVRLAKDSERFSFYWIHQLLAQITPQDEEQTLVHYQRMLRWCKYKHSQVINGEHSYVGPEAQYDTLEFVEALMKPYGERSDIGLIRAVGQNLPHVIKTRGNIVEHMVKDGMLDAFYEEGLGLQIANGWEANLAQQAVHRYPRMNIIEIGGGTGGSTRMILPKLGKAFSTYTFTDISAGFFDAAEERFSEYADRMIFRTFDMEKDITEQGYVEGHYDMVLASNVLHAGPDLDFIMSNVRKLVKPGGLLINMEAATYQPSLRNGFAMAGLPGWWCGAETGRPWGPTISVEAWDELFKKTGWSGVDTRPPHMDELHHFTVMVTQAVDDRINFLREPLVIEAPDTKKGHLVIVGGKTDDSADIVGQLEDILAPHYSKIDTIITLEEFADITAEDPPTVLNLSELDAAIMEEIMNDGPEKFDALKDLFVNASDIVWVTKNNRFENPFSRMVPGMARALIKENPHVKFKSLDVDTLNDNSATLFAEELLRHQKLVQWSKELAPGTIHWSEEPEVHYVDGRAYVPRLKPVDEMNFRYNSQKRIISNEVNPSETTIALAPKDGSYELRQPTPVKLQQKVENGVTIKVSKSLLQSVQIPTAGHFFLCYGTNESDEKVVALSNTSESVVEVPDIWTIPYKGKVDPAQCLLSIAANMYANVVIADAPANSTLLVHDPDPVVAAALFKQAAAKKMRVFCTTSNTEKKGPHWIYVHPQAPSRLLKKKLPKEISTFVYVTGKQEELLISNISKELPFGCEQRNLSAFFGTNHKVDSPSSRDFIAQYLSRGWSMARASNFAIPAPRDTVPLKDVTSYSRVKGQLAVVDWETTSEVPVNVHAVDACDAIFKSDRTYLMVGLSGDVGQTLTQWMVLHGARHVVLTSRNPKVNTEWIDNLEEDYGADVRAMKLDITDRDELHAVYNKITRTMPPIAGVAHGAMVLVDNLFQNMEYEELMTVLKPKVLGAIYLDELFSEDTLDFFILFSSITGVVGNTGQSNYMAGNFFLEALGLQRRNKGLVASVIGISSLVGVGYVERSENFDAGHFKRLGYRNVSEQDVQMLFAEAITQGKPGATGSHEIITGVVPRFANQDGVAAYLQDVKFGHLILERTAEKSDGSGAVQVPVRVQLQTATTEDEAREIMQIGFTSRVKKILRIPEEEDFSDTTSLVEQGVDSLVAVEIRGWFLKEVDVDIPVLKVLGGASIQDLLTEAIGHLAPAMIPQMGSTSAGE
jgi:hybrid polyketide synthase/nonribosomal peptide synthetase ACE1